MLLDQFHKTGIQLKFNSIEILLKFNIIEIEFYWNWIQLENLIQLKFKMVYWNQLKLNLIQIG